MKSDFIYLIYDTETTGLSSEKNAICEIAVCVMDNGLNDIGEYESGIIKVYDNRIIDQRALDANGITHEQLKNGREGEEVLGELIKFIKSFKKSKTKVILCGQNIIKFDNPHLNNFFNFFKKDLSSLTNNSHFFDTLFLGRVKHEESNNYKLGTLCENVGIDLIDAHRALNDAKSNKEIVKHYIRGLRGQGISSPNSKVRNEKRPVFQF